jgi:hypothetical protein
MRGAVRLTQLRKVVVSNKVLSTIMSSASVSLSIAGEQDLHKRKNQPNRQRPYTRKSALKMLMPISHSYSSLRSMASLYRMEISGGQDDKSELGLRWTIGVKPGMYPYGQYSSWLRVWSLSGNVLRVHAIVGV